jgi:hypothetical protein
MTVTLESALRIADDVDSQELDSEMVLLSLDRAEYFGLNASGTIVWKALANGRGLRDIAVALAERFSVDGERAAADVVAIAQQLIDAGLAQSGNA